MPRLIRLVLVCALLLLPATVWGQQSSGLVVRGLSFEGNHAIDDATLAAAIATTNSSWFATSPLVSWASLGEKRTFDETQFRRDVLRIKLLYGLSGYPDATVDTSLARTDDGIKITFSIHEGLPVIVQQFEVNGLDSVAQREKLLVDLPLQVGDPFNRLAMATSGDSLVQRLRNRGYPSARVFRNFEVDRDSRTATVTLDVDPGTYATIGPIRVNGESPVDTAFLKKLITTRSGQRFSQEDLYQSQRALYKSELFQFASVGIDSAGFEPGDSIVPLVINVRPGHLHRWRGSVGYGTTDCFRGGAGWTARNFLGGGRVFDLSGRVSKLGVGSPADVGLENSSLCPALKADSIGSRLLNYNVTASVRKPAFLSPRNTATYTLYAERRSEYTIYLRNEVGGSFTVDRETTRRIPFSLGYKLSYGRTEASSAIFCAFFSACTASDISQLRQSRFLGTLTATASLPRTNNPLDPSRGYHASAEVTVSAKFLGSSSLEQFVKAVADVAWYRELSRDVVLSWRLRGGVIFAPPVTFTSQSVNFVPPDQRFYAGGPNDVRGFPRNELGPGVYVVASELPPDSVLALVNSGAAAVRFSATGGNTLGVGNVELRVPSPLFRSRLRLALFVDAGTLWERGKTDLAPASLRVTPGFGFRIATPLGPARLDIAYNGYRDLPGSLYESNPATGELALIRDHFSRARTSRFTFQFAIGQPF